MATPANAPRPAPAKFTGKVPVSANAKKTVQRIAKTPPNGSIRNHQTGKPC